METYQTELLFYIIGIILGSISIIFSLPMILVFIKCRDLRSFIYEIVCYLSIASILNTLSYIIYFKCEEHTIFSYYRCVTQGSLMICFELSQAIWTTLMCIYLYLTVKYDCFQEKSQENKLRVVFIIIGYGCPVGITLTALFMDKIGDDSNYRYCWFKKLEPGTHNIFAYIQFLFIWILILLNILFIFLIRKKNLKDVTNQENTQKYIQKLCIYPIIMISYLIPSIIYRIIHSHLKFESTVFEVITLYINVLQGFFYAVSFICHSDMKHIFKEISWNMCICCPRRRNNKLNNPILGSINMADALTL